MESCPIGTHTMSSYIYLLKNLSKKMNMPFFNIKSIVKMSYFYFFHCATSITIELHSSRLLSFDIAIGSVR